MGRRPAHMNPSLIEPDCRDVKPMRNKKPRLTASESAAMAALLSFRMGSPPPTELILEANRKAPTTPSDNTSPHHHHRNRSASMASNITDDEESICSRQSHDSLMSHPRTNTNTALWRGSPPPAMGKALVKPGLPVFVKPLSRFPAKLPQGRPLKTAPGLAKHLVKQTQPICLKLSSR